MLRKILLSVLLVMVFLSGRVFSAEPLELSSQEKVWIEKHPVLRVSGPRAFPPFHFVGENNQFKGMADDYLKLVAEMIGVRLEYRTELYWPEVLKEIEARELDVIACAAKSPDRDRYLTYTTPHLSFPIVIIARKDALFISGLDGLHKARIAMTKGIMTYEWLKRDGVDFTPVFTSTMLESLEMVSVGHADAAIQNLAAASYHIEKRGLTNLKVAAPTPYGNYDLAIAIRSDWPELATIFNKALAQIDNDQHNEIRQRWISIRFEHGVRFRDILYWTLITIVASGIVVGLIYAWNRRLAGEITERKRVQGENEELIGKLQTALEEIKTLKGILPLCSFCKKIRKEDGDWEQVDVYINKHSQADISHSICPDCLKEQYPEYIDTIQEGQARMAGD